MKIRPNGVMKDKKCKKCRLEEFYKRRDILNLEPRGRDIYKKYKKTICAKCGFTGDPCQLDVHHIDGNHTNNSVDNLETLCANCHRLVTKNEKHGIYRNSK